MVTFTKMNPGLLDSLQILLRAVPNEGLSLRISDRLVEVACSVTNHVYSGWVDSSNRIRISIQSMTNHCEATLVLDRDLDGYMAPRWVDVYSESRQASEWLIDEAHNIVDVACDIWQWGYDDNDSNQEAKSKLVKHLVVLLYRAKRYQEPMSQPVSGG